MRFVSPIESLKHNFKNYKIGLVLVLLGVIWLFSGFNSMKLEEKTKDYKEIDAVVYDVQHTDDGTQYQDYIFAAYKVNGIDYEYRDVIDSRSEHESKYVPSIGEKIRLVYNPDNPKEFYIRSEVRSNKIVIKVAAIMTGIGILWTVIALILKRR